MISYSVLLDEIISEARIKLGRIEESSFSLKTIPEKWSKKEILGHLVDSAYNNYQRFIRAEEQGNLVFNGYNQVDWVRQKNYQNRSTTEIIDLFLASNMHIVRLLANLPSDLIDKKTSEHNFDAICMRTLVTGESSSLGYLIADYIFHVEHHLYQILNDYEKKVEKPLDLQA